MLHNHACLIEHLQKSSRSSANECIRAMNDCMHAALFTTKQVFLVISCCFEITWELLFLLSRHAHAQCSLPVVHNETQETEVNPLNLCLQTIPKLMEAGSHNVTQKTEEPPYGASVAERGESAREASPLGASVGVPRLQESRFF